MGNEPRPAGEAVPKPEENPKGTKSSCEPVRKGSEQREEKAHLCSKKQRAQLCSGLRGCSQACWPVPQSQQSPGAVPGLPSPAGASSRHHRTKAEAQLCGTESQNGSAWKGPPRGVWSKPPAQAGSSRSTWHGTASRRFWNIFTQGDSTVSAGSPLPSILPPLWDAGHGRPQFSPSHVPLPRMMQPAATGMRRPPPNPALRSPPHPRDPDAAQDTAAVGMVTVMRMRRIRKTMLMRRRRMMKVRRMRGV